MDLLLTTQRSEPRDVVICGELDIGTLDPLRSHVSSLLEESHVVRLDLAGVTFMDCATLGLLVALSRHVEAAGGSLQVSGLRRHPRRLVRMFRLEETLGLTPLDEAAPFPPRHHAHWHTADEEVGR